MNGIKREVFISASTGKLAQSQKTLIKISACLAAARYTRLRELVEEAVAQKIAASRIYEVLLQAYLFLGYPRALEGIKVFREVVGWDKHSTNINFEFRHWSDWKSRGGILCQKVYGKNFNKLVQRIGKISPELSEWMIVEGYGKVLSRGVLSGSMRELCTVAALTVTSDINQLHSHIRGAHNLGAARNKIHEAIRISSEFCSKQNGARALKLYNRIFSE